MVVDEGKDVIYVCDLRLFDVLLCGQFSRMIVQNLSRSTAIEVK
jgi:hypothetical protein